uniref:Uncharacterized protein n=1 Tax=Anguilla anguilla TaxID=7936 RepID=A0A0E9Q9Z8_ANGAN
MSHKHLNSEIKVHPKKKRRRKLYRALSHWAALPFLFISSSITCQKKIK